ncbi:hypothetical protein IAT38_002248 [Cryptococcus sp. DSM 104549]
MTTLFTATVLFLASAAPLAGASEVLFEMDNAVGTVYYDIGWDTTGDRCAPRFGAGWAPSQIGHPGCAQNGPTQEELGTNRIVAMNQTWMEGDKSAWCGKEVKVFTEDGKEIEYDEPLVLWDTCAECAIHVKIDFAVDPYLKLAPDGCGTQAVNPAGLKVQVMDNQIWAPAPGSESYSPTSASTLYTGGVYNQPKTGEFLTSPWGATISGDAANDPVVIKTASSGGGGGGGGSSGGSSAGEPTVTATATGGSTGATSAGGESSQATGSHEEAVSGPTATGATTTAATSQDTVVPPTSVADPATTSAQSSAAPTTVEVTSDAAQPTATAAGTTGTAIAAVEGKSTCTGDDGQTYQPGDNVCQGNNLMVCAYTTSGSTNVDWIQQSPCAKGCSIECGMVSCLT